MLWDHSSLQAQLTVAECLNLLHESITPTNSSPVQKYQHVASTRAPPHYDHDVMTYIGNSFPDQWHRSRGSDDLSPWSPDWIPSDFSLWASWSIHFRAHSPQNSNSSGKKLKSCATVQAENLVAVSQFSDLTSPTVPRHQQWVFQNSYTRFTNASAECNGLDTYNIFHLTNELVCTSFWDSCIRHGLGISSHKSWIVRVI
jgi:hypothetical protein